MLEMYTIKVQETPRYRLECSQNGTSMIMMTV
jgi:hypothetical protein